MEMVFRGRFLSTTPLRRGMDENIVVPSHHFKEKGKRKEKMREREKFPMEFKSSAVTLSQIVFFFFLLFSFLFHLPQVIRGWREAYDDFRAKINCTRV